jgi:hypothetical protein
MYTNSSSKQQQSLVAVLQHMTAVALRNIQGGSTVNGAQQPSTEAALLQQQLQLLSVQACSAAAQLQLLFSSMTRDQMAELQSQQQIKQFQQQQAYAAAEAGRQAADQPSSSLWQHKVALAVNPAGTQATPGSSPITGRKGQWATAPEHWLRAKELQLEVVPHLLVLQACLVQNAASDSVRSRAGAAAQELLSNVQPESSLHQVYLLISQRPEQPHEQGKLLQHLLCLQEQQEQHLSACEELQGGGSWSTQQQQQELSCRAVVAAEVNRLQQSLLCVCVELLREVADVLRSSA